MSTSPLTLSTTHSEGSFLSPVTNEIKGNNTIALEESPEDILAAFAVGWQLGGEFAKELLKNSESFNEESQSLIARLKKEKVKLRLNEKLFQKKGKSSFAALNKAKSEEPRTEKALKKEAKKADVMMTKLIQEESRKVKKGAQPTNSPSKKKKDEENQDKENLEIAQNEAPEATSGETPKEDSSVDQPSGKRALASTSEKPETSVVLAESPKKPAVISDDQRLYQFIVNLCKSSKQVEEDSRIQRWKTTNIGEIRQFVDKERDGTELRQYQHFARETILEQRFRHFLPGTERLINAQYRSIYTSPIARGCAAVAKLLYKGEVHNGELSFGVSRTETIFHKHFKDVDFSNQKDKVFKEARRQCLNHEVKKGEGWQSYRCELVAGLSFDLGISREGVLSFSYPEHEIRIFPLKSLFKN